jgi:hypothetical protein
MKVKGYMYPQMKKPVGMLPSLDTLSQKIESQPSLDTLSQKIESQPSLDMKVDFQSVD